MFYLINRIKNDQVFERVKSVTSDNLSPFNTKKRVEKKRKEEAQQINKL